MYPYVACLWNREIDASNMEAHKSSYSPSRTPPCGCHRGTCSWCVTMDWFDSEAPKPSGGKVVSKPRCCDPLPWCITGCRLCLPIVLVFCPILADSTLVLLRMSLLSLGETLLMFLVVINGCNYHAAPASPASAAHSASGDIWAQAWPQGAPPELLSLSGDPKGFLPEPALRRNAPCYPQWIQWKISTKARPSPFPACRTAAAEASKKPLPAAGWFGRLACGQGLARATVLMWKHCGSCIEQVRFTRFYYLYFMASLIHELPRSCFPSFVLTLQARVRFCPVSATKCQPGQSSEHATTPAAPASGTESPAERTWEHIEGVDSSNHYCPKKTQ